MNPLALNDLRSSVSGVAKRHHLGYNALVELLQAMMNEVASQGVKAAVKGERRISILGPEDKAQKQD